jgi:hypothetical protein
MSIFEKIKSMPKWAVLSLSTVIILGFTAFGFYVSFNKFKSISGESLSFFDSAFVKNASLSKEKYSDSLSTKQISILLEKVDINEENKKHHLDLVKRLYNNNYALLTLLPIFSAITAIFVFLLIQKGWESSHFYLKAYFILFTTLTTLIGVYPEVYKQTDSIDKNLKAYLSYEKIQKTIFSYTLTAPLIEKKNVPFNEFLDSINTQEKELFSILFGLQQKTISEDIYKLSN